MFGEKKSDIFELIPEELLPKTKRVERTDVKDALSKAREVGYPHIAKPDIGERGIWVRKIADEHDLIDYAKSCPANFLLQEYVPYPLELGIFYVKYPNKESGVVTSVVRKQFLSVVGNGVATIDELLQKSSRAKMAVSLHLQVPKNYVPKAGETVEVSEIGNHCRGACFIDDSVMIDEELCKAIDSIAQRINGFYFGRLDVRCDSYENLKQLKNIKILELNGAGAEPGHIYHPGFSLLRAYKDIFWHLRVLADISAQNQKRGTPYWSFSNGYKKWRRHTAYIKLLAKS